MKQLGDVLLAQRLLTPEQLQDAVDERQRLGGSLGRTLVDRGLLSEQQLVEALARQSGLEFVDLAERAVDVTAVSRVPETVCRRHRLLPLGYDSGRLVVAMADPSNVLAIDDLRSLTGLEVKVVVAAADDVLQAIDAHHRSDASLDELTAQLYPGDDASPDGRNISEVVEDAPIVRFVNLLITRAVQDRASDIHIEPGQQDLRVRYRIDGVLHEVMRAPRAIASGVVSRLKIMADIDIAERRVPQDGRLSVGLGGRTIDLRVASLPTVWGEKIVLRVLDNSAARYELGSLGFTEANYRLFADAFSRTNGLVLVTGPTGSGKSTTLYAALNAISRPEVNVITVEDPVEYRLPGINQVQTNAKSGLTFSTALRSILRSDPDVLLVGEIRDHETATIATEAALTGHLVLSTLHTNDAPGAVVRLTEMGVEPFLVGSALTCVVAQRLARKLCSRCTEPYTPDPVDVAALCLPSPVEDGPVVLHRAVGCSACSSTGYRGRVAVHEVMPVDEDVERLAVSRASSKEIAALARERGMRSLRDDGMGKALAGVTTVEEIFRVVA